MNKAFDAFLWENYPKTDTPLGKTLLNKVNTAVDAVDDRVIVLDSTKATKVEVSTLIKEVAYDEQTGIITFTRKNGATFTIDTPMEKIALNIYYDPVTEMLTLPLIDGTQMQVDLSRLITEYEFLESDTIAFSVGTDGKVSAIVKEGSIQEKHLRPNYLAEIKVESAKAESAATSAETSKTAVAASASTASSKASEASASATNAANSASTATTKANEAATSATNAGNSATSASNSATMATNKANDAATSATNAANSASTATTKANAASTSATNAATSATNADTYAKKSQSYAVGTGNARPNEATDNAKYYYEQARDISQGLAGAIMPMGTVAFANLPALSDAESGWMYNVSNQFTTTADFKEGVGNVIPAGANVYKTADEKWDVLAGTPVTTVNGQTGNVNITAQNINALTTNGDAKDTTVTFTSADVADGSATAWTSVAKLTTGEKLSSFFNKISTMFKNVRYLYKMLGTTDISAIGGGTVTGAISKLNTDLGTKISDSGDTMIGPLYLGNGAGTTSPAIVWWDKNRNVWAGTANGGGDFYLYDHTNSKHIIQSTKAGVNNFNGHAVSAGTATYADNASGNLQTIINNLNTTLTNAKLNNTWSNINYVNRDGAYTSNGSCEWFRWGRVIILTGIFTPKNTNTYSGYKIFTNLPKVYGVLRTPVWTDDKSITAWVYGNDGETVLYLGVRGELLNGKLCHFTGVYITSD